MPAPNPVSEITNHMLSLSIKVNGIDISDTYTIMSASIVHEIYCKSYAEIVFLDGGADAATHYTSDSDNLTPGNEIEISAGFGNSSATAIFTGIIEKHNVEIATSGASRVKLLCKQDIASGKTIMPNTDAIPVLRIAAGESILSFNAELSAGNDSNSNRKGHVSIIGNGTVKTGDLIQLEGVGKKFDGNVFVTAVTHALSSGNWHTTLRFGLDGNYASNKKGFTNQAASKGGLHTAKVQNIIGDPEAQYRVQVQIGYDTENPTSHWARMGNLYATSGAGTIFYPEIDDEVIVGFLEGDANQPIILGSVYSGTKKPPIEPTNNNNYLKSLVTKAQLKLTFDDEKKIITIETPGGNSISINDDCKQIEIKDQNANSIRLGEAGIDISSDKDVTINAQNIALHAKQKIALSAKMDTVVTSSNIQLAAAIGFTAKGSATAELSAGGQTTVKGGMVLIN